MENRYTTEDLKRLQALSLERKIQITQTRIIEWYQEHNGRVCVNFSGGKDSTVLLDLARRCYPNMEGVFADTGLEFPEIREFVRTKENITWVRPEKKFFDVVTEYGWNYPSKDVSLYLWYAKHSEAKKQNYINRFLGLNNDGSKSKHRERYKKFAPLLDAPFIFSSKCCRIIKEQPLDRYMKEKGLAPIVAIMASESSRRKSAWLKTGCNNFDGAKPLSKPMSFWTDQDVLKYLKDFKIPYASIYGDIIEGDNGALTTTGEKRTGCMFCPVGCHLDKDGNKFQNMKKTHPKQWEYCIFGGEQNEDGIWVPNKQGLGLGKLLDYIGVPYE